MELTNEETTALYKIIKDYLENKPTGEEIHFDYYDNYEEFADNKTIKSILKKLIEKLSKKEKEEIDKDFLRKKYHPFNNEIDEKAYASIEKAFNQLRTIEIEYFNMESAEFRKRKIDIYYKSMKYIIGYCHLRKDIRKFRTSRIKSARLINTKYKIPEDFDKNKY